jgi:phosphoglucosamine mutase
MLSAAFQAGVHSVGVDTVDVGVFPSGGIGRLTASSDATMGVIITASHNPAEDNGIKLINARGAKLAPEREASIESLMDSPNWATPRGPGVGARRGSSDALNQYLEMLTSGISYKFRGISVVLDTANGAAYQAAPELMKRLSANFETIHNTPDGNNINLRCGATDTASLRQACVGKIGLAFDGDADRLIAVDEQGREANGDVIMAVIAKFMKESGKLRNNTVVGTVMSNLGFKYAMRDLGIEYIDVAVGDRHVSAALEDSKGGLGGEQSGHVIFPRIAPTGDGLLTAVRLLEVVAATGKTLAELREEAITEYPQVLRNVTVADASGLSDNRQLWAAVEKAEASLGSDGRILVRASGTEPLIRVMVEASSGHQATELAVELCEVVRVSMG